MQTGLIFTKYIVGCTWNCKKILHADMIIREHAVDWPAACCDAEMELFSMHCANKVDQIQKEYEKGLNVL